MTLREFAGRFTTAARALPAAFSSVRDRVRWKAIKTILTSATTLLAVVASIAGIYAFVVYLQQRREESRSILRGVEEELIFHQFGEALEAENLRSLKARIDDAYEKDPKSSRAWALGGIYQAYISFKVDAYKASALAACARSLDLDDRDPLGHLCTGIASISSSQYRQADNHLRKALEHEPLWATAWYYYAFAQAQLGQSRLAEQALENARRLDAARPFYGMELSEFYWVNGRQVDALSTIREVAEATQSPAARNALAVMLYAFGDISGAYKELSIAVKEVPMDPKLLTNMAALLNGESRHKEALPVAMKALGLNPASRDALVETVMALEGQDKHGPALHYSKKLILIAPDFRWIKANHEYLTGRVAHNPRSGAYMHTPHMANFCDGWILTRLHDAYKEKALAVIVQGKIVFPSDQAGRTAEAGEAAVTIPSSGTLEATFKSDFGAFNTPQIDPEWLNEKGEEKEADTQREQ